MNPDEYKEAVLKAKKAMEGVDLDPELEKIAFSEIVKHLLESKQYKTGQDESEVGETNGVIEYSDKIGSIAKHLNIDREGVNMVFSFEEEEPRLAIPSVQLASAKKKGTEEIALLIGAAHTALGKEEIEVEAIRQECTRYDKFDSPNFMKVLNGMTGLLSVKGRPRSRKKNVILKKTGLEEAARIIQRLASSDA